ncbi:alpha/beta fold hydrolase [Aliiglaciecola sp. LCG003]|uniref:alpha/beta fold hydrolase n=1 Tax=Aliiglaciecola sp. LCG003 TaxID=3053655 RepID=UPI00257266C2|nr:alpha/beta fold hydrolase [Aliiglaciecola sp. LCG003]WJG09756.1 alpha/beta hydrolase [Aliiglaciecola sp. LCG003]
MNEEALLVGPTNSLVAVFTPSQRENRLISKQKTAVLLLNSGLIHHAGPGRIYTQLARNLAQQGSSVIRFDLSGIGDSVARQDNLSIYQIATQEPAEVMDYLQKRGFERFILVGICSGAYCAFKTALVDERVVGIGLVNYQDDTANDELASQAWAKRYWTDSVFRIGAWKNLISGKVNYRRLISTLTRPFETSKDPLSSKNASEKSTPSFSQELDILLSRNTSVLMLMSGLDISQQFLSVLIGDKLDAYRQNSLMDFQVVDGADHLFTNLSHQHQFIQVVSDWVQHKFESRPESF